MKNGTEGKRKPKEELKEFDLCDVNGNVNSKLSGEWWICEAVYVSDVCIAVHLVPNKHYSDGQNESRKALYKLLRNISATALITDIVRPVAAVISNRDSAPVNKDDYTELNKWSADQAWHRGHFCLYVVPDLKKEPEASEYFFTVERMLCDLLSPKQDEISDIELISVEQVVENINAKLEKDTIDLSYLNKLETWWRDEYKDKTASPNAPPTWSAEIRREAEKWIK